MQNIAGIDVIILVGYFVVVGLIGWWASKTSMQSSKNYFLGGEGIGWMAIGASLFASNISAEHFIGLASSGSASGLAVGQFEWIACFILLILGWFFVPFYLKNGVFTMPEFLEKRFNRGCRNYLAAISLIAYIFTKVSVALYAGALVLRTILGWDMYVGAIVLVIATGIYTVFGGLRAVIYTDFIQAFILIAGGVILTLTAITKVGGFPVLASKLAPSYFSVWQNMHHPDFPWTGILFGAPILGIWYWCTDQMIVQKTLAAKNVYEGQKATIFAGFLKILPVFILVLPGLAGAVLFPGVKPDEMYATMVNQLLPAGIKGLVIAALLAALMSSLSSVFNSSSTLAVMDFYREARPNATEKELVFAGQVATGILVVGGLAWLPIIGKMSGQLYVYLQSIQAYVSPPIACVFLIGLMWKRVNGAGALAALLGGFVVGAIRFIAELGVKTGKIAATSDVSGAIMVSPELVNFANINFLHFAIILFAISTVLLVAVSLMTPAPSKEKLEVFTAKEDATDDMPVSRKEATAISVNVGLSVVLAMTIIVMWFIFSPFVFR